MYILHLIYDYLYPIPQLPIYSNQLLRLYAQSVLRMFHVVIQSTIHLYFYSPKCHFTYRFYLIRRLLTYTYLVGQVPQLYENFSHQMVHL